MLVGLFARVATAVVGLPLVALLVWQGGPAWLALLALAAGTATHEYSRTVQPDARAQRWLAVSTSASLPVVVGLGGGDAMGRAFLLLVLAGLLAWVLHLRGHDNAAAERGVGDVLVAVLLPAGGLVALAVLRQSQHGLDWVVLVLAATAAADTGALLVGRAWGRHRLCPRISPGKSWEGLLGGALAAAVTLSALRLADVLGLSWVDHAVVAAITGFIGPLGDLSKSMVKRAHGLKDFGRLLPGHGGMLDRIDALVFNAPCVLAWMLWLRPFVPASA